MGTAAGLAAVPTVSQSLTSMLLSGSGLRGLYLDTSLGGTMFAYAALVAITATFLIDGVANINSLKIFDSAYTTVRGKPFAAR